MSEVKYNDRAERFTFGGAIIAANLLAPVVLSFVEIPQSNIQLIAQCVGGFNAALGIIVAATWKTNSVERQQAATLDKMVAASAVPMTETITRTMEPTDGQSSSGQSASGSERQDYGGSGLVGQPVDVGGRNTPAGPTGEFPSQPPSDRLG